MFRKFKILSFLVILITFLSCSKLIFKRKIFFKIYPPFKDFLQYQSVMGEVETEDFIFNFETQKLKDGLFKLNFWNIFLSKSFVIDIEKYKRSYPFLYCLYKWSAGETQPIISRCEKFLCLYFKDFNYQILGFFDGKFFTYFTTRETLKVDVYSKKIYYSNGKEWVWISLKNLRK